MSHDYTHAENRFIKDAAQHVMTVIRDDGVYRHLRFRKAPPAGSLYWFDLITWPGSLCIDGDMGTYVFRRLDDMFEFFRADREYDERQGRKLGIDPSYWSEKLQAPKPQQAEKFSPESFRVNVKEAFDDWVEHSRPYADDDCEDCTQEQREAFDAAKTELWESLSDDVLACACDGDVRAFDAANDFLWKKGSWRFSLDDCWEWSCKEYTSQFIWCCHAIAWGVKTYDESPRSKNEKSD